MKRIIIAITVALLSVSAPVLAEDYVRGYTRSDGTSVDSYYRSSPNSTQYDNYSTRGNYNPHTGRSGSKNPMY